MKTIFDVISVSDELIKDYLLKNDTYIINLPNKFDFKNDTKFVDKFIKNVSSSLSIFVLLKKGWITTISQIVYIMRNEYFYFHLAKDKYKNCLALGELVLKKDKKFTNELLITLLLLNHLQGEMNMLMHNTPELYDKIDVIDVIKHVNKVVQYENKIYYNHNNIIQNVDLSALFLEKNINRMYEMIHYSNYENFKFIHDVDLRNVELINDENFIIFVSKVLLKGKKNKSKVFESNKKVVVNSAIFKDVSDELPPFFFDNEINISQVIEVVNEYKDTKSINNILNDFFNSEMDEIINNLEFHQILFKEIQSATLMHNCTNDDVIRFHLENLFKDFENLYNYNWTYINYMIQCFVLDKDKFNEKYIDLIQEYMVDYHTDFLYLFDLNNADILSKLVEMNPNVLGQIDNNDLIINFLSYYSSYQDVFEKFK